MEPSNERVTALIKQLSEDPQLLVQVEALVAEIKDECGKLSSADEAEDAVVSRIRQLGRAALTSWAQQRCARQNQTRPAQARRCAKKNCAG